MVSFENCEGGFDSVFKRSRMNVASPSPETLTLAQQRQTARNRKQKLVSKLRDSGFEEDLACSPISSPAKNEISLLMSQKPVAGQLCSWYLQYGDIGFMIQREKEAQFHPCKSLARQPQCCCLAVNIMDRFLASTPVAADCFQLIGVTALLLASKQVEVCSPRISHLLSLCCDVFTKEQLCNLECLILLRLNFRLSAPTLAFFLDYYTNCIEASQLVTRNKGDDRISRMNPDPKMPRQCSNLAQNVCELTLADYAFNKYPPSLTASCALRVASELLKSKQGLPEHETIHSHEVQWDSFVDELCTQSVSFQPTGNSQHYEGDSLAVKDDSYKQSLVQECKDNLKLLVSLNLETLDVMSTM
ncbi:cyclin-O isoform X2 [Astatotilapia calliptera]|uniref:cyclin-O isoform X2 n=1 Tax=Astatotilapia calliptera TaxID=8154 RepID=UPI000E41C02B|nr:cyclin-O isoform X2 [Astatotilapia calliptera]